MVAPPGTKAGIGTEGLGQSRDWSGGSNSGGANPLGKVGPFKKTNNKSRTQAGKAVIGSGSATTQTYEATSSNLATAIGGTLLGAAAPGIGIAAGPVAAQGLGFGYENPTGTTDQISTDAKNEPSVPEAPQKPSVTKPKPKKPKPLLPVGFELLSGMPGTLLGT